MNFSWPYVAGLFDGEGTVFMRSSINAISPILAVYQGGTKGKQLLNDLQKWLIPYGANGRMNAMPLRKGQNKTVYVLTFSGRNSVGQFIANAFPHLNVKKTQAQDIWRFICMYKSRPGKPGDWSNAAD